jgi:rhamnogalacturonan acetylesterase
MTFTRSLPHAATVVFLLSFATAWSQTPQAAQPSATEQPGAPVTPPQANLPQRAQLNPNLPTIFVVGDSTASNGPNLGWGDHLANYFDTTKVNVANRAHAGRSARSYMVEGAWDRTLAEIKPGDYVLLQWGQNDGGDLGGAKPRGDLRGDGDATQDVMQSVGVMAGKVETVHTYGWYNRKYVADTLAKGATPMFLTMTIHNSWRADASGAARVTEDMRFGSVMWKIAQEDHLAFIDMGAVEATRMESVGKDKAALWFPIDYVHTSPEGAELNAQSVVIALEIAKNPLVKYLKAPLPIPPDAEAATKKSEAALAAYVPPAPPPAAPTTPQPPAQ